MKILVTGASGMLGGTLVDQWQATHEIFATGGSGFTPPASWTYRPFDLAATDHSPLTDWAQPEVIVHCAAITSVDACERTPERTLEVNGRSVGRLLAAAPRARMLYMSSDAVLGSPKETARETAVATPLNAYGRSKLLGEQLVGERGIAIRTTVLGWNRDPSKQSFVEWIVRSVQRKTSIKMFEDAVFSPIAAADLCRALEVLLETPFRGALHITGRESISKYDFGVRLCERLGLDTSLIGRGRIAEMSFTAPRSSDQSLDVSTFEQMFRRRLPTIVETIDALAKGYLEPRA